MGVYTQLSFVASIKKDDDLLMLFTNVSGRIAYPIKESEIIPDKFRSHPLFHEDWHGLFRGQNCDPRHFGTILSVTKRYLKIRIFSEFKNYEDQIDKFLDFIGPYVAGHKPRQYVGWYKLDEMKQRINLYIDKPAASDPPL